MTLLLVSVNAGRPRQDMMLQVWLSVDDGLALCLERRRQSWSNSLTKERRVPASSTDGFAAVDRTIVVCKHVRPYVRVVSS